MAKDIKTYHEQTFIEDTLRLREILTTLPAFAKDYFRAMEPTTSAKTRISYAYDIRTFSTFWWNAILCIAIAPQHNSPLKISIS
jgi:hypothetical protein